MRNLALLPVSVALLVYELARAMVRAYQLEDDGPPDSIRRSGGWRL